MILFVRFETAWVVIHPTNKEQLQSIFDQSWWSLVGQLATFKYFSVWRLQNRKLSFNVRFEGRPDGEPKSAAFQSSPRSDG